MAETEEETPDRTFRTYGSESGRPASHLSDGSGREPTRSAAKVAAMPGSWWLGTMPRLLKAALSRVVPIRRPRDFAVAANGNSDGPQCSICLTG